MSEENHDVAETVGVISLFWADCSMHEGSLQRIRDRDVGQYICYGSNLVWCDDEELDFAE